MDLVESVVTPPEPNGVAAVRIRLRAMEPTTFKRGSARPLHAAMHRLLEEVDPVVSRRAHDETIKSFTLSPLYQVTNGRPSSRIPAFGPFRARDRCWVRLTTLDRDILSALLAGLATHWRTDQPLMLDWHPFMIDAIEPLPLRDADTPHMLTYRDLVAFASPTSEIALRFVSPVMFRSSAHYRDPTDPWRVFSSYLRRWQQFADIPLPGGVAEDSVRAAVAPASLLALQQIPLDVGFGHQLGYTGEVRFRIDGDADLRHGLAILAAYATWCGTGARSAFGLGQTRHHVIPVDTMP